MKYLFILGTNPALSIAEIVAALNLGAESMLEASQDYLLAELPEETVAADLMGRLGGTIKIAKVIENEPTPEGLAAYVEAGRMVRPNFGISRYDRPSVASRQSKNDRLRNLIRLGMETKRLLKEAGIPSRFVRPQEGMSLSSVAVDKNGLMTANGTEFVVFGDDQVAVTEAIQPFEDFSEVDFGRPARNAKQGMLPPKLARIMVNLTGLTGAKSSLWDPFCGSGTIVTEAYRMGIQRIFGSDINPQAITDSKRNLTWIQERDLHEDIKVTLEVHDAKVPFSSLPSAGLDAVAAEVFLGAPQNGQESTGELLRRLSEITLLVEQSLRNWKHHLKPGAAIVLALPAYIHHDETLLTEPEIPAGYEVDRTLPPNLKIGNTSRLTPRGGILYGRPGQLVWREIVRLRKTIS